MSFKKITAFVRPSLLGKIEEALKDECVPGLSVSQVKGYGEYANLYAKDCTVSATRIEVFIDAECAESVAQAIMCAAHTGLEGDGIVVISPVEQIYHVITREKCIKKPC